MLDRLPDLLLRLEGLAVLAYPTAFKDTHLSRV